MKDEMPYSSVSGTASPRMVWSHPGAMAACWKSNRFVFSSLLSGTFEYLAGMISAAGLSLRRVAMILVRSAAVARSVLFRMMMLANSIWSIISSGTVRSSSSLSTLKRSLRKSPVSKVPSKFAASMTVTHVSRRARSLRHTWAAPFPPESASSPFFSSAAASSFRSSSFSCACAPAPACACPCSWSWSWSSSSWSWSSKVKVSATCKGSLMPVDSITR
mmetsp:Transcript_4087/g.15797  ORF Transcript_4087/g.15797 Transcript_4087/m.15797 type:complete len:218 (-) Transcript_4087:399-1052(-)